MVKLFKFYRGKRETHFPVYCVFYKIESGEYHFIRVKSGPLSKWGFDFTTKDRIEMLMEKFILHEGPVDEEVKQEVIEGIFGRGKW